MSNTFLTTVPHELITRGKGKYHAAIALGVEYRTACGETFPTIGTETHTRETLADLILSRPDRLCKRCDRVGAAIVDS